MNPSEAREALAEIEKTLADEHTSWHPMGGAQMVSRGAKAFSGDNGTWHVLVVSFPLESGSRGYDGTATHIDPPIIVHLPPKLAERAFKIAEERSKL